MIAVLTLLTTLQLINHPKDSLLFYSNEELIEIFIQQQIDNEVVNIEEIFNKIEYYKSNKIEVKVANAEDLKILPGMNEEILNLIIELQKTKFITKQDFLNKDVSDKLNLHIISQFIIFEDEVEKYKLVLKNRVVSKSTYSEQSETNKYNGELFTNYNLISFRSKNVAFNYAYKRDAGELFKYGSATYYLLAKNIYFLNKIILGSYSINFGQGILISTNPNYYLSATSFSDIYKESELLRGSSSPNELYSLKGGAAEFEIDKFKTSLFYSKNNLAATVDALNNVKSIYSENLFRTENEINKINKLNEGILGVIINYKINDNFNFGYGFRKSEFSKRVPLKYLSENIEKINFSSIVANYNSKKIKIKIDFSGEQNITDNKILGFQIYPSKQITLSFNKRNYKTLNKLNYINPLSSQPDLVLKEDGVLYGINLSDLNIFSVNGFIDNYNITETNFTKSTGSEVSMRIFNTKNKYNYFEFTKKYNNSISELPDEKIISKNIVSSLIKNKYRIQKQNNYKNIALLNRFELLELVEKESYEKGILFSTTINYKSNNKFKLTGNLTFYKTDSFNSRIWEYESNGRGYLAFVPLFSSGIKKTFSAELELFKNINLSIRYSQNTYDKNEIFYTSPFKNSSEVILQIDYLSI